MSEDLFFIPIIAKALKQKDRKAALSRGVAQIEKMGRDPRYRQGVEQFHRFMAAAGEVAAIRFIVEHDGRVIGELVVDSPVEVVTLGGITPGRYALKLSTGRLLWEGDLREFDLLWAKAFGRQPLRMAAAKTGAQRPHSKKMTLLDGEVVLYVFPGVEMGEIGIALP